MSAARGDAEQLVREQLAALLECRPSELDLDASFGALGLDSLKTAELVEAVAAAIGIELGDDVLKLVDTPAELVRFLAEAPPRLDASPTVAASIRESGRQLQVTNRASLARSFRDLKRQMGLAIGPAEEPMTTFLDVRAAMADLGGFPWNVTTARATTGSVDVAGSTHRIFSSYSYLGLLDDPRVRQGALDACKSYGTGAHGVRALAGDLEVHRRLERRLADLYRREAGLLFSSGYLANVGVLPALIGERDYVLMDAFAHVSLLQGCQLSQATILRFRHNDIADARAAYAAIPPEDLRRGARVFLVADSVFSMDGDVFDLPAARSFCDDHDVFLVLDEAHAFGCIGPSGLGIEDHYDMAGATDLIIGTLSKGIPSMGGFAVGDERVVEFLRFGFAAPNTFSSPLGPYHCGAALAALDVMEAEPKRVRRLHEISDYLRESLRSRGFDTGLSTTPIVPLLIGGEFETVRTWRFLLDHGYFTAAVIAPAVPLGKARLRLIAHAATSREEVDDFVECLVAARAALAEGNT